MNNQLVTRRLALMALASSMAPLLGCGGGASGVAGLSSGGTGSFTSGTIIGFGSVIVNGIRYDDSQAIVETAEHTFNDSKRLDLGMWVTIEGGAVSPATTSAGLPTAVAQRIIYGSEWLGPVEAVDTQALTLTVLGQTVDVLASSVVGGDVSRLADITTAHVVECYGYVDVSTGHLQASRIDVYATNPSYFKVTGVLSALNTSSRTALIGATPVSWNSSFALPLGLANGAQVRATLSTASSAGRWMLQTLTLPSSPLANVKTEDGYEAEVEGTVSQLNGLSWTVSGVSVDASAARIDGSVVLGALVEVKGTLKGGVLVATEVEVKSNVKTEAKTYEFYGSLSAVTSNSFVVKGITFAHDGNTQIEGVTLQTGATARVEVKAIRRNDGWYATKVEADN